jgi:hypothetical protein
MAKKKKKKVLGSGPNEYCVIYNTAFRHALDVFEFFSGGEDGLKYGERVLAETAAEAIAVVYDDGNSETKAEIVDFAGTCVDNAVYFDCSGREGYIAINMRFYGIAK